MGATNIRTYSFESLLNLNAQSEKRQPQFRKCLSLSLSDSRSLITRFDIVVLFARICIFNFRHLIFVPDDEPISSAFESQPAQNGVGGAAAGVYHHNTFDHTDTPAPIVAAAAMEPPPVPPPLPSSGQCCSNKENQVLAPAQLKRKSSLPLSPDSPHLKQTTLMAFYQTSAKKPKFDISMDEVEVDPSRSLRPANSPNTMHMIDELNVAGRCLVPVVKRLTDAEIQALRIAGADDRSSSSSVCSSIITNLRYLNQLSNSRSNGRRQSSTKSTKSASKPKADNTEEYIVQQILRVNEIAGKPHFLVKWKGYSTADNTWEPLAHVRHCDIFKQFLMHQMQLFREEIDQIATSQQVADAIDANVDDAEAFRRIHDFDEARCQSNLIVLALMMRNDRPQGAHYVQIQAAVRKDLHTFTSYMRRMEQLEQLHKFEQLINATDKSSNLTVENLVDFEGPPERFTYINDVFAGTGVTIPDDPIIGCDCAVDAGDQCHYRSQCCGKNSGGHFAYSTKRRIRVPRGTPVFECNRRCSCGPECHNRVVQQGRKHSLCIFKTPNGCGWGVRTLRTIWEGQFICEYVGEILTYEETERRGRVYDAQGRTYLFDLDMNSKDNPYTIDAAHHGNVSHFINHSCDPNCGVWAVWIDCMDMDLPRICLFALRKIEAGEELSFDYMNQTAGGAGDKQLAAATTTTTDIDGQRVVAIGAATDRRSIQMECRCGTAKCRKLVF